MQYLRIALLCVACIFQATPAAQKPMRKVEISAAMLAIHEVTRKRVDEAQRVVEASPEWKNLIIAQSQEQTSVYYIMAEIGLKPSDECTPVFDEKTKALVRFDCPIKDSVSKK